MTTHNDFQGRNRTLQDLVERHLYGDITDVDGGGRVIRVRGNGTEDDEVVLLTIFGLGGKLKKDSDVEVYVFNDGSDATMKYAVVQQDHKKERKWKEGTNGIQNAEDAGKALELNRQRIHATDKNFAVGDGLFEVKDGKAYLRVPLVAGKGIETTDIQAQNVKANKVETPSLDVGNVNSVPPGGETTAPVIPAFDNSEGTPSGISGGVPSS